MKPIRHLIAIVFLLCGLTARGSERVYDRDDMVGTYKYEIQEYTLNLHLHTDKTFMVVSNDSHRRFGKWEVEDNNVILHSLVIGDAQGSVFSEVSRPYDPRAVDETDQLFLFVAYDIADIYSRMRQGPAKGVGVCHMLPFIQEAQSIPTTISSVLLQEAGRCGASPAYRFLLCM